MRTPFQQTHLSRALRVVATTGCLAIATAIPATAGAQPAELEFSVTRIALPDSTSMEAVTGRFTNDTIQDIALADFTAQTLSIYARRNGEWSVSTRIALPAGTNYVDVVRSPDRDRVLLGGPHALSLLDPIDQVITRLDVSPPARSPASLPPAARPDLTRDLNGDGADDLVIAISGGIEIHLAEAHGSFASPLVLPRSRPSYARNAGLHTIDANLDGLPDLAIWEDGALQIRYRLADGGFQTDAVSWPISLDLLSDNPAALAAPLGTRYRVIDHDVEGAKQGRALHAIRDFNGDGLSDLGILELTGDGLMSMGMQYWIYPGIAHPNGLSFATPAAPVMSSRGIPFGIELSPGEDGPGSVLMATNLQLGLINILGGLITHDMTFDVDLYDLSGPAGTPAEAARRRLLVEDLGDQDGAAARFPPLLRGDLDGDGAAELIVGYPGEGLRIYRGRDSEEGVSRRAQRVSLGLDRDERAARLADLDRDGDDELIVFGHDDDGSAFMTVLEARNTPHTGEHGT